MIKSAIQIAYRTCTYAVCTFVLATSVSADAWAEWETRCLSALKTESYVDTSGLPPAKGTAMLNAMAFYDLASGATMGFETRLGPPKFCSVTGKGAQALVLRDAANAWMNAAVVSGDFEDAPVPSGGVARLREPSAERAVHSTDRSGRYLVVQLQEDTDQSVVFVEVEVHGS